MSLVRLQALNAAPILHDLSLTLEAGELCMLVGPNGAGKSTLLQHLAGLRPSAASLWFAGENTQHWQPEHWARRVSYLTQLSTLNFPLTVSELIGLGALTQSLSPADQQALLAQALQLWQLQPFAARDVRLLSGGEQQRVQLARTWLQLQAPNAKLWLLDEPLSALDLRYQVQCLAQLRAQCQQGKTVLMVAHDLNLARRYADRVLVLDQGRLVADGEAKAVLSAQCVSRVFGVQTVLEGDYLHW